MKKRFLGAALTAATLALVAATPQVSADHCCDPCNDPCWNPCDCDGNFGVGAHALYWKSLDCPLDWARIPTGASLTGDFPSEYFTVSGDYDWGFRIWGQYECDCFFAGVGYTYYDSKATQRVTNADLTRGILTAYGLVATAVTPALALAPIFGTLATIDLRYKYQNVDVRAGYQLCNSCCGDVYMFGNVRWVDLENRRESFIEGAPVLPIAAPLANARLRQRATYKGAGLGFGIGGEAPIWCDLHLFGEFGVAGILGSRKTPVSQLTTSLLDVDILTANFTGNYSSTTSVIPEANAKIGVNYTYTCGCWTFVGEVGYEVDYFWNAFMLQDELPGVPSIPLGSTGDLFFARSCHNVGFAGPFFGARVLF